MANVTLTKESRQAKRILKCINNKSELARALGTSKQNVTNKFSRGAYQKQISELIILLDVAGYEIVEKE